MLLKSPRQQLYGVETNTTHSFESSDTREAAITRESPVTRESPDTRTDTARSARLVVAGELVAAITHDLRQPLTAIEMNVAAALRRLDPPPDESPAQAVERRRAVADALRDALAEQRRMREALQVLQDLAARREPSFDRVDLSESVREVVRLVASDASSRHVNIDVIAPVDLPHVSADATLVRQALLNIVLDALEATSDSSHEGGPVVVTASASSADTVDVVVTHFGERADSTAGLGLALARSVTDAHAGTLRVTGDPQSGVTVTTQWPIRSTPPTRSPETRRVDD
jgi:two-component system sensor kinase FixL